MINLRQNGQVGSKTQIQEKNLKEINQLLYTRHESLTYVFIFIITILFTSNRLWSLLGMFMSFNRDFSLNNIDIGVVVVLIVWQSVPITTNIESSNPAHGEVYSTQHYVIKFVIDLRHVGGFLQVVRFPPSIKLIATI